MPIAMSLDAELIAAVSKNVPSMPMNSPPLIPQEEMPSRPSQVFHQDQPFQLSQPSLMLTDNQFQELRDQLSQLTQVDSRDNTSLLSQTASALSTVRVHSPLQVMMR